MDEVKTILVTTDFSDTSKKAFPLARELAERFGAKIIALHVEEHRLPPLILEYTQVSLEEIAQRQQEHAKGELTRFVEEHLGTGVETEVAVVSGTPHQEIARVAEEREVDLIVMATHGRGFISRAILGSTTERVLRHAHCPVLSVHDGREG